MLVVKQVSLIQLLQPKKVQINIIALNLCGNHTKTQKEQT